MRRGMARAALILALVVLLISVTTPIPVGAATVVSVAATQPWTDTGIDVINNSSLSLSVTGRIRIAGSDQGKDPNGDGACIATADNQNGDTPWLVLGQLCWSVIGRIDTGTPFEVGYGTTMTITTGGHLYLGVNDTVYGDNSGAFSATISTQPSDITPPVLQSISVSPTTVAPGDTITLTAHITDDLSGTRDVFMSYNPTNQLGGVFTRIAGTPQDGTWQLVLQVPTAYGNGQYTANHMYLYDYADHMQYQTALSGATFNVVSTQPSDITPPVLQSISVSPTTVAPGDTITLTAHITDDLSGTRDVFMSYNPTNQLGGVFTRIAGTPQDGTWQLVLQVPTAYGNGQYTANHMYLYDYADHMQYQTALSGATFNVVSTQPSDITPPVLQSISVSPTTVAPGDTITLTAHITDDLSGTRDVFMSYNPTNQLGGVFTRIAGTPQDGTWQLVLQVPTAYGNGQYTANHMYLYDYADHMQYQTALSGATFNVSVPSLTITTDSTLPAGTLGVMYPLRSWLRAGSRPIPGRLTVAPCPPASPLTPRPARSVARPRARAPSPSRCASPITTMLTTTKQVTIAPPPPAGRAGRRPPGTVKLRPIPRAMVARRLHNVHPRDGHVACRTDTGCRDGRDQWHADKWRHLHLHRAVRGQRGSRVASQQFTITINNPAPTLTGLTRPRRTRVVQPSPSRSTAPASCRGRRCSGTARTAPPPTSPPRN